MKTELPNEKFDQIMHGVMRDADKCGPSADDFADSTQMLWSIKRRIAEREAARSTGWLPTDNFLRLLFISAPALAAAVLLIGIIIFFTPSRSNNGDVDNTVAKGDQFSEPAGNVVPPQGFDEQPITPVVTTRAHPRPEPAAAIAKISSRSASSPAITKAARSAVVKTDFIPLTYAQDADSGQIVRVKVPRSMMVSLGLVNSVAKPSEMIDAEVVVGDDGLTRAIRFSR